MNLKRGSGKLHIDGIVTLVDDMIVPFNSTLDITVLFSVENMLNGIKHYYHISLGSFVFANDSDYFVNEFILDFIEETEKLGPHKLSVI